MLHGLSGEAPDEPVARSATSIETDTSIESTGAIIEPKLPPGALSTPAALAPLWARVIRAATASPVMRAILMNSTLARVESGIAPPRYASGAPKFLAQISDLITREHGSTVKALVRTSEPETPIDTSTPDSAPSDAQPIPAPAPRPVPSTPANLSNATDHPLVKHALELFGGRIVDIQPRRQT